MHNIGWNPRQTAIAHAMVGSVHFCGSDRGHDAWIALGSPQTRAKYLSNIECDACLGYECSNLMCPCCLQDYKHVAALLQTCTMMRDVGFGSSSGRQTDISGIDLPGQTLVKDIATG